MKRFGWIIIIFSLVVLLAVGIAELTGLTLKVSAVIATAGGGLVFLMLDPRPKQNPNDATIIRLTKGSWYRKRK